MGTWWQNRTRGIAGGGWSLFSLVVVVLVACSDSKTHESEPVATTQSALSGGSDPVVRYFFNEASGTTASDSSGNGHSATLQNGATFVAGARGNAVRIAGGTQRVALPAGVAEGCQDLTIAARVRLTTNSANWARIFDIGNSTTSYMFLTPRAGTSNVLRFAITTGGGAAEQQLSHTYSFPTNTWKHVAVVLNGNTGTLYLDGVQVAQNTNVTLNPSALGATANNWLGDSQFTADPTLDGTVDDVLVSCRPYSASEVSWLASGTDPQAQYAFNETSGTSAADSSGNARHGTLVNGASFVSGLHGNAVQIAGGSQRVNLPTGIVQACNDLTIAAHVRLATNAANWARIFDFGASTSSYMFLTPRAGASNILRFAITTGGGAAEQRLSHTLSFPTSTWKHVAVVLSGNTGTMYLDGVQVAQNTSMTLNPSQLGATANNWLGDSQFTADPTLNGTIDNLLVSCRPYSPSEIGALAGACTSNANCDDGNPCTTDACSSGFCSRSAVANGTSCADPTVCNGEESCQSGFCSPGTPPVIDDGNACTTDACDPIEGVTHTPITGGGCGGAGGGGAGGSGGSSGSGGSGGGGGAAGTAGSGGTAASTSIEFFLELPPRVRRQASALASYGGPLLVHDAVKVVGFNDLGMEGFASLSSVRTQTRTELGVSAEAQSIFSQSGVFLRNNAVVHGDLVTQGTLEMQAGASVVGETEQGTNLEPVQHIGWSIPFPTQTQGPINIEPSQSLTVSPGAFAGASIKTGARLTLSAPGRYTFDGSFTMEPGSFLTVQNTEGAIEVYIREGFTFRGAIEKAAPNANFLIGIAGPSFIPIERSIDAIIVAPNATVDLATVTAGHRGSVFAKSVVHHQSTTFNHDPFEPRDFCPLDAPPSPFCPSGEGGSCTTTADCDTGPICENGKCTCGIGCSEKACGDPDPTDNCGRTCVGRCGDGEPGCTTDDDCAPGSACMVAGAQKGFSPSTRICLPAGCRELDPRQENCGVPPGVDCGPCPACVPDCDGKNCGPDGCGGLCGATPGGSYCDGLGVLSSTFDPAADHSPDFPIQPPVGFDGQEVGTLPGTFLVADNGTANYSISLELPPGRSVQPALSLAYSSTKANGILGAGWSLTGLSTIARCPRTIAQDRFAVPVGLTASDRFCIDGQRIVLPALEGVNYGEPSSEYRTEIETFSRIELIGPTTSSSGQYIGPRGFRVWNKDGRILIYGVPHGAPPKQGQTHPVVDTSGVRRIWALARVEDRAGHRMDIQYRLSSSDRFADIEPGTGELLPDSIAYGAQVDSDGDNISRHDRSVRFSYTLRNDARRHFVAGFTAFSKHLLTQIETRVADRVVRRFHLEYPDATIAASPPPDEDVDARLLSVRMCAPRVEQANEETCLPATEFGYNEQAGLAPLANLAFPSNGETTIVLDADGDGRDDVLIEGIQVAGGPWRILRSREGLLASLTDLDGPFVDLPRSPVFGDDEVRDPANRPTCVRQDSVADMNLDGRQDLVDLCTGEIWLSLVDSGGQIRFGLVPQSGGLSGDGRLADLDGDGLKELIKCDLPTIPPTATRLPIGQRLGRYYRNIGTSWDLSAPFTLPGVGWTCPDLLFLDVDGDGDEDLLKFPSPGQPGRPVIFTGRPNVGPILETIQGLRWSGHVRPQPPTARTSCLSPFDAGCQQRLVKAADINGDGLKDLVMVDTVSIDLPREDGSCCEHSRAMPIAINTGRGFETRYLRTLLPPPFSLVDLVPLDVDGDGREDLVGHYVVMRSTESGDFEVTFDPGPEPNFVHHGESLNLDADGDGSTDLLTREVRAAFSPFNFRIRQGRSGTRSFLSNVTDGLGKRTFIDYSPFDVFPNSSRTYQPQPGSKVLGTSGLRLNRVAPLVSFHSEGQLDVEASRGKHGAAYRYHYYGANIGAGPTHGGRGWLGFGAREIDVHEGDRSQGGILPPAFSRTRREFENDLFWRAGRVAEETTTSALVPVGTWHETYQRATRTTNTWELRDTPFSAQDHVWLANTTTSVYEGQPAGSPPTVVSPANEVLRSTSASTPDPYANTASSFTQTFAKGVGVETTIKSVPERVVDEAAWLLTNPEREIITSSRLFAPPQTRTTRFEYYSNGLLRKIIREPQDTTNLNLTTELFRDPRTWNVETIEGAGEGGSRRSEIRYDARGFFPVAYTEGTGADELVTEVQFDDGTGQLLAAMDPNGRVTRNRYDGFGRTRRIVEPTHTTSVSYAAATLEEDVPFVGDVWGAMRVTASTPDNGRTERTFDAFGRVVRIRTGGIKGVDVDEEFLHDWAGRVIKATLPHEPGDDSQGANESTYDPMGRLVATLTPDGRETRHEHFSFRTAAPLPPQTSLSSFFSVFATARTDPNGLTEFIIADHAGLPTTVTHFDATGETAIASTAYTYGAFSDPQTVRDPDGELVTISTDRLGRRTSIEESATGREEYAFNAFDEVVKRTDGNGDVTCNGYDSLGRLRRMSRPGSGTTCDAPGGPASTIASWEFGTDANANARGRIVSMYRESRPGQGTATGTTLRYAYQAPSQSGSNTGLIESIQRSMPGLEEPLVTSFEYDGPRLHVIHYPVPSGQQTFDVELEYDTNGNVERVFDPFGADYWKLLDDDQGIRIKRDRVGAVEDGSNVERDFAYYSLAESFSECVSSSQTVCMPGTLRDIRWEAFPLRSVSYRYDRVGNISSRFQPVRSLEIFKHDAFSRLVRHSDSPVSGPGFSTEYAYSRGGDILSATTTTGGGTPEVQQYSYEDPLGRAHLVSELSGGRRYRYDGNGSMTERRDPGVPGERQGIDYNDLQMPWQIRNLTNAALDIALEFDAGGSRVAKRQAVGETTLYAGDLYECIGATPTTSGQSFGCEKQRYKVFGGSGLVAQITRDGSGQEIERRFVHGDQLGSTSFLTDEDGDFVESRSFDAFGKPLTDLSAASIRAGFTGHEHDSELGLINMRGRLYDPALRRFVTADPFVSDALDPQGLNRYSYVRNNPVTLVDPSGFQTEGQWNFSYPGQPSTIPPPNYGPPGCEMGCTGAPPPPPTAKQTTSMPSTAPPASASGPQAGSSGSWGPSASDIDPWGAAVAAQQAQFESSYWAKYGPSPTAFPSGHGAGATPNGPGAPPSSAPFPGAPGGMTQSTTSNPNSQAGQSSGGWPAGREGGGAQAMGSPMPSFLSAAQNWITRNIVSLVDPTGEIEGLLAVPAPAERGWYDSFGRLFDVASLSAAAGAIGKARPGAYSVAFEVSLPARGVGTYPAHFAEANGQLLAAMQDPQLAAALRQALGANFEGSIVGASGGVRGVSPAGWTWHHVPGKPGILQLVPAAQHAPGSVWQGLLHPGGLGGMAEWGSRF